MSNTTAAIITIGDELLIGQTIDTNSAWIAQKLNELGIDVVRRVAVGDVKEAIVTALDEEIARASIVLLTGGLGPTSDDITKPLLCAYFGGTLKTDERVLAHLKDLFFKRKRPVLERNMKQAEVPDNCMVLFNKLGTAPGMLFYKDEKMIISMPGVPVEMMSIMEDEVLPLLRKNFKSDALLHRTIFTAGEGESVIAEQIAEIENALPPYIKLAYLPDGRLVKLRLTGRGADKEKLDNEIGKAQLLLAERLADIVIAMEDIPVEQILGNCLVEMKKTIGLAESCTGGFIGHYITNTAGSSAYFTGSVVSYDNEIKKNILGIKTETLEKYGSVSLQTAEEMAIGAHRVLKSDYTLAVTGVLGPGGATERVKTGTVCMAVFDGKIVKNAEFHFFYDRLRNKEMAAKMGMLLLWKFINGRL